MTTASSSTSTKDVRVEYGTFQDTSATISPLSQEGRDLFCKMFGSGAMSAELPKTRANDFARFVSQKGLSVQEVVA